MVFLVITYNHKRNEVGYILSTKRVAKLEDEGHAPLTGMVAIIIEVVY
jgi:hypothetical protein